jgi:hypothetical protein
MKIFVKKMAIRALKIQISMANTYILNDKLYDTGTSHAQPDCGASWISD